jgi:hypothetical protein
MILTTLHKEPTALDTVLHRDLRLDTQINAAPLMAPYTSFMITVGEFAEAARDFPILFVKAAPDEAGRDTVAPVIVFGMRPGENVFLKDGQWMASYLPALLRAYPFTMARIENSDRWAMVFDNSWSGFSRTEGTPLFDENGQATEMLNNVHKFVQELEADVERTRQACAYLQQKNLLKPMRFDATMANGETLSVDGFMTLDEEAFAKLADKDVVELFRNGLMYVLHMHRASLANMRRVLERRMAQQAS